jgi:hypothetical protein
MTEHYVVGRHDGVKRSLCRAPKLHDAECGHRWEPVDLELNPGQWVRQIVATERIKRWKKA